MSRPPSGRLALTIAASLAVLALALEPLEAQTARFRFSGADMLGGAVFPDQSETGVAFGTRVSVLDLSGGAAHMGAELDWWTADSRGYALVIRNATFGIGLWHEPLAGRSWRPFLGLGAALHSIDVRRDGDAPANPEEMVESARLDGVRPGAAAFAGLAARLTETGAIWLVIEFRHTVVSRLPFSELRLGARLTARRQR